MASTLIVYLASQEHLVREVALALPHQFSQCIYSGSLRFVLKYDVFPYDVLLLIHAKECANMEPAYLTGVRIAHRKEDIVGLTGKGVRTWVGMNTRLVLRSSKTVVKRWGNDFITSCFLFGLEEHQEHGVAECKIQDHEVVFVIEEPKTVVAGCIWCDIRLDQKRCFHNVDIV